MGPNLGQNENGATRGIGAIRTSSLKEQNRERLTVKDPRKLRPIAQPRSNSDSNRDSIGHRFDPGKPPKEPEVNFCIFFCKFRIFLIRNFVRLWQKNLSVFLEYTGLKMTFNVQEKLSTIFDFDFCLKTLLYYGIRSTDNFGCVGQIILKVELKSS